MQLLESSERARLEHAFESTTKNFTPTAFQVK